MATNDPMTAARFAIIVDGEVSDFTELQGITTEIEVAEYMASSDNDVILKKLPGRTKPPTITLRRGKDSSTMMSAWHDAARQAQLTGEARKSCSLVMYNAAGAAVARYHLNNAWPTKIELAGLRSGTNEVLMESVTITCESLTRMSV